MISNTKYGIIKKNGDFNEYMNGKELLKKYVDKFNANDFNNFTPQIGNEKAYDFLSEQIPFLHCPDKDIEETYYFRFWTLRKHIKKLENGKYVFSEFLEQVPWAGQHNTIVAAIGHHISEARWLSNGNEYIEDYVLHFLENGNKRVFQYSSWLVTALYEYCRLRGDFTFMLDNFDLLEWYYHGWENEKKQLTKEGLYWSIDNFDAMEYSISGHPENGARQPGIRPTLNSYMYSAALVLAELAKTLGFNEKSQGYASKAEKLRTLIEERLWDGEFYKAIHADDIETVHSYKDIVPDQNARELIGYIPFIFGLGDKKKALKMFPLLTNKEVFLSNTGLSTADRSNPRYLYKANHECLWNGYIWPFATSQTLDACINAMNKYGNEVMSNEDFTMLLSQYAKMHHMIREDGVDVNWIDEMMHPDRLVWETREWLYSDKYVPGKGGKDRGKDYNHSTFCDIVIRGLVGVDEENGKPILRPHIPADWNYLKLENLTFQGKKYDITYDKNGDVFGAKGWNITER